MRRAARLGLSVASRADRRSRERRDAISVRVVGRQKRIENGFVSLVRQAAAICNVTQLVVRRWLSLGLLPEPPWTLKQLDLTDPVGRRRGSRAAHGTMARWNAGCSCTKCRRMRSDAARARGRGKSRLPVEVRKHFLHAIHAGRPFREVLRGLGLTSNQVGASRRSMTSGLQGSMAL